MRFFMGVVRGKNGICYARKKVPRRLEGAAARVLGMSQPRLAWLKRSLRTRDQREANVIAKPVLIEFDSILAKAAALVEAVPMRSSLSDREIETIAQYHRATVLAEDEETRREGTGSEEVYRDVARQLERVGVAYTAAYPNAVRPQYGLSERELEKRRETIDVVLPAARHALARGAIGFVQDVMSDLLDIFRVNLDRSSSSYRKLGTATLREWVSALETLERRNAGHVVATPRVVEPGELEAAPGEALTAAFEGWKKAGRRTKGSLAEFSNAVRRFIELHGDLPLMASRAATSERFGRRYRGCPSGVPDGCERLCCLSWLNGHSGTRRLPRCPLQPSISCWGASKPLWCGLVKTASFQMMFFGRTPFQRCV